MLGLSTGRGNLPRNVHIRAGVSFYFLVPICRGGRGSPVMKGSRSRPFSFFDVGLAKGSAGLSCLVYYWGVVKKDIGPRSCII